jgi:hypothetical protein
VQFATDDDPHALTWDPASQVATVAINSFGDATHARAIGLSVAGDHLTEAGRIEGSGADVAGGTTRTLVANDRLWLVAWEGVSGHDRSTLATDTPALHW